MNLERNPEPMPLAIPVAIAAIWRKTARRGIEVLVQRRPDDAARGGVLELPGGKIEPNESPIDAARREVREELSIAVAEGAIYGSERDFDPSQAREPHVVVTGVVFAWQGDDDDERRAREHGAEWLALEAFDAHEWPRANAALNRALRRTLSDS